MSKAATIKGVSIKPDDIVRIKFKSLDEIIAMYAKEKHNPSSFLERSEIDHNLSAILEGGCFKVDRVNNDDDDREFPQMLNVARGKTEDMPDEISIENYLSSGDDFTFNENIVEEISVEHDVAKTYFSSKFKINVMNLNGALYVNNELVTKNDAELINILESAISDLVIQNMLSESE